MLDLQLEQQQQGQSLSDLYDGVLALKRRFGLDEVRVRARDSLAVRRDGEREQVHELLKRYRDVTGEQQKRLPALLNSLAQLEVVVGEYDDAQQDFDAVAGLVSDHDERADAHHNAYQAALERRDWPEALAALLRACALSPGTCEPFPLARFEPRQVLGAGAFGATFLCAERDAGGQVVVKALREDSLDRPVGVLFRELTLLQELDHPALVRVRDFGWADADGSSRPYVVLEHFEGPTLAEYVRRHGPLAPDDALAVLWPVARALQAAHARGVLHRGLGPSCVLVRRVEAPALSGGRQPSETPAQGADAPRSDPESPTHSWQVKVLDTGLALKRTLLHAAASSPAARAHTGLGRSVARALGYAPPEVSGRPKGMVWVGPHSDVFSFGKLCCFALTGRPEPGPDAVPEAWREAVAEYTAWTITARPEHFGPVLERLSDLAGAGAVIDRAEKQMDGLLLADYDRALSANPDDAAARLGRANLLAQAGDERALADYAESVRLRPDDPAVLRRRAQFYLGRGDLDEALADLGHAVELAPDAAENWSLRAGAHARRGDHAAAAADYGEAIRLAPKDESAWFGRANAHYCNRDYEAAIADYTAVLRLDPKHVWAYGNRGKARALCGEHDKAVADFTQLLRIDPENARAWWDRALSLWELGRRDEALADYDRAAERGPCAALFNDRGLARAARGEHEQAVAEFTRAHELEPESCHPLMYRGNSYSDMGELEKALADLDEAARLGPEVAVIFYNRGNVHAQRGDHDAAVADFTRAVELAPDYGAAYYNRANSHVQRGDLDAAIADYTAALRHDPEAAAYNNRGNAYSNKGDLDAALADFSEALRRAPEDVVALFNRANTHCRLGDFARGVEDYTEVLRLQPDHARAYNNRGNAHTDLGDAEKALADFTKAVECDPNYVRAHVNRAGVLAERGERERSLADYDRALELDCGNVPALVGRGNLRAASGEFDAALADFSEVLRLDPQHAGALVDRANVHYRRGDRDAALADLARATEVDPGYAPAWYNRANLLSEQGDLEGAIAAYTRVIERSPRHLPAYHNRGRAHARRGDYAAALADNLEALRIDPDSERALNNLAWLWATCRLDEYRDGARALEHALRVCERTGWQGPGYLDTLAAAYAECGQFEEAARWQARAVELAPEVEKDDYRGRLELYRQGTPYREV